MKKQTMLFILTLTCALLGTIRNATADSCTVVNNTFVMTTPLTIPRDVPVGTKIGGDVTTPVYTVFKDCIKTTAGGMNWGIGTNSSSVQVIGNTRVYATGIPGVGYAFAGFTCNSNGVSPYLGNYNMTIICGGAATSYAGMSYVLRFYKTAATTGSGNVASLAAGFSFMRFEGSGFVSPNSLLTVTGLRVTTTTCSVDSSNVSVTLPPAELRDFTGVGSSVGSKEVMLIIRRCGPNLRVAMYLDEMGTHRLAPEKGILSPASGSTSSGIALQLLYQNSPVRLGKSGVFSVLSSATIDGGNYAIPMVVRYYQTATPIKIGTVQSSVTFTMVYN